MVVDGKVQIEKFDGKKFGWWKMQIEALLCQKDLDVVLEDERLEKMPQADWDRMDKKARAVITLSLSENVAFNLQKETSARGMMAALSNMYEKPSAMNKVYLIRELVNTRMREGDSVTAHINNLNSILSRLVSVNIKFDDEVQALLLLSSLPDSWSGTVTAVTSSSDTSKFTFVKMRDLILGEDVRRRNSGGSSCDLMHVGRGRKNNRCSGSKNRKMSQSRARNDVTCWNCKEVGHFRNQCPNDKKEVNAAVDHSDDEVLICNVESSVDSWVMDSGA
ncbi:putative RNA-directed DNA polymerase [Helianthus debilis subsp. tardiflorus]